MKKKVLASILIASMTVSLFTGCGCARKEAVKQKSDIQTVEVGHPYSFDINDLFDCEKELTSDDYTLDVTSVDTTKLGEYDATITIDKTEYKFKVVVEDTVAPTMKASEEYYFLGDLEKVDWTEYVTTEDYTDVAYTYSAEKIGNASVVNEETIEKYFTNHEADSDVTEDSDGYYKITVTATDEGKNTASVDIYAVVDTTAPVATYNGAEIGESVTYKDGQQWSDLIKVTDNMSGTIEFDECTWNLTDGKATLSCADKCGNTLNISFDVVTESVTASNSGASSNGGGSSTGASSNGNGGSTSSNGGTSSSAGQGYSDDITQATGAGFDPNAGISGCYTGWVNLGNGYDWDCGGGREVFLHKYGEAQHMNTPWVNENDYWSVWVSSDNLCKHGVTLDECCRTRNDHCEGEDLLRACATKYVQSLYGPEYTAWVYTYGQSEEIRESSTKAWHLAYWGHDIAVKCPDGVTRCLETDNSIVNVPDGSVWKTP